MKLIIMGANWLLFLLNGVFLDALIDNYWENNFKHNSGNLWLISFLSKHTR